MMKVTNNIISPVGHISDLLPDQNKPRVYIETYYLSESSAPKGIFLAPYIRYQSFSLSVEEENAEGKLSIFGGGLLVGAQTLLKDVITIEAFIGPAYGFGNVDVESGSEEDFEISAFDGFLVRAGVTVGIGF
ncbi:unnamed protein product [marine sediment metagenome]|uniref:Outer membrane protein beta-barrel domain-containing protein n=1 Tax=marine sediment metagenome TaxID=412755 RepID=X0ZXZ4_9ZZZZ